MNREWKSGDVAMVKGGESEWVAVRVEGRCLLGCAAGYDSTPHWHAGGGAMADGHKARPLVVIDPEDREQAMLLYGLYYRNMPGPGVDQMQAALREFANPKPPKPEEPTGFGAVAEDAEGEWWVRITVPTGAWWRNSRGLTRVWRDIDAVRVLSEGVTERADA
jgi:hypothetical protein